MLKTITDAIERSAAAHVDEHGVYAPLIEHLYDKLDAMRAYSRPGEKSSSMLAGFSLAITCAKEYALRQSGREL